MVNFYGQPQAIAVLHGLLSGCFHFFFVNGLIFLAVNGCWLTYYENVRVIRFYVTTLQEATGSHYTAVDNHC